MRSPRRVHDVDLGARTVRAWVSGAVDADAVVFEDRFVPPGHAERLAARIPAATARLLEGHGHLSIATERLHDVLEGLATDDPTEHDGPT